MARSINPLHDRQHEGPLLWRRSGSAPLSTGALVSRGRDSKKGRPGLSPRCRSAQQGTVVRRLVEAQSPLGLPTVA